MVFVYGCINPPAKGAGYDGTLLTEADMDRAAQELVGKPILMEHSGPPVGSVDAVWRRPQDGRLMMVGHTNDDSVHGRFIRNMLGDGTWRELSLSTTVPVDMKTLSTGRKTFNEVSIVEKGLRDGTTIEAIEDKTNGSNYKSAGVGFAVVNCSQQSATMSAAAGPAAAAAPPPAAADASAQPLPQEELLRRIAELQKQVEASQTNTEHMEFLSEKTKRTYANAFNAFAESYLNGLQVDDAAAKENFIAGLKRMTEDPSLGGREADAVLQVVCAASKAHQDLTVKYETTLQDLKTAQEAMQQSKRAKQSGDFVNIAAEREVQSPAAAAGGGANSTGNTAQTNNAAAAAQGMGMAGTNPKMFGWLTDGINRNQTGMPNVAFANIVNKEFPAVNA